MGMKLVTPNTAAADLQARMKRARIVDYEPATRKQVAEAALAGYRTGKDDDGLYPWLAYTPDGEVINRYITQREAWAACYHVLQVRLEGMEEWAPTDTSSAGRKT